VAGVHEEIAALVVVFIVASFRLQVVHLAIFMWRFSDFGVLELYVLYIVDSFSAFRDE
jgi:hypothetical protein